MTSAGGGTPVAPAQGIAAPPTTLAAGVVATVPFPAQATGRAPQPWRTPWVVLLNSSPFTLVVSSGGQTTQIAAFTSDKVFAFSAGNQLPVTVLPTVSASLPTGGQDSTLYATWYHDEPPGTYPAALGSGAAQFAQNTIIVPFSATTLPPGNQIGYPGGAGGSVFNVSGFGGMTVFCDETLGLGPVTLEFTWADAGLTTIAQRWIIVPAGGTVMVSVTHMSPFVAILIRNNNAAVNIRAEIEVTLTQQPLAQFDVGPGPNGPQSFVALLSGATLNGFASLTQIVNTFVYAGPATLYLNLGGCQAFTARLQYIDNTGAFIDFGQWNTGSISPWGEAIPITLPPFPIRLLVTNNTNNTFLVDASIVADDWRVG